MAKTKLTGKQKLFVEEYLLDLNASAAVLRAGYNTKYPDKVGAVLLANKKVSGAIADAMRAREERTGITQDFVVRELANLAVRDGQDVFRHSDKLRALELLGKHLGMFADRVQMESDQPGGVVVLAQVMAQKSPPDGGQGGF